jgi:outer membrane protein TolC
MPQGEPPAAQLAEEAVTLTLEECLRAALENNLDIAVGRFDPLKSQTLVTVQKARFDPLITGSSTSTEDQQRGLTRDFNLPFSEQTKSHLFSAGFQDPLVLGGNYRVDLTAADSATTFNSIDPTSSTPFTSVTESIPTAWALTFTQPLLRNMGPGANRAQIVVARNNMGVSEAQFRQTVMNTLSDAEKAYWDLNFALMDLKTVQAALQLAKDFLEQNRIKVRVGTLAPIDITQAEAGVADREEAVIVAENAVMTAEDNLRRIMNVPRDAPTWGRSIRPSDAPPLNESAPEMAEAVNAAEGNRPDLEQARLNLKSRETDLAFRRNQKRWGLDFQGSYGVQGFDGGASGTVFSYKRSVDDLRDRNQDTWSLMLNLSVPLGNRLAEANFTNAEYAVQQARYDLERLEQVARIEVRNAVRAVATNLKRVKAAQVNTRLQRETLQAEQKKFENGMSTSFQVLQIQTDLTSAESRENQAIIDYNKSLVELERVKGTILQARKVVIPGDSGGDTGEGSEGRAASMALRGLWLPADARAADTGPSFDAAPIERVTLPARFVLRGRRLVGVGAAGEISSGPADLR